MSAALLLLWIAAAADAPAAPDTVVVCPAEYQAALAPWLELRTGEGHAIRIVSNAGSPDDIRARIRAGAAQHKLRDILLVGSAESRLARTSNSEIRRRSVPTHFEPARVDVQYGSEPEIATDAWYADLDDDGVPDVAIGRLPVASAAELAVMVQKIVAYERSNNFSGWRSRISFSAGRGDFGEAIDGVIQANARRLVESNVPAGYQTNFMLADWHSAYCPDPRLFHATTLSRLNEGCWFWVYLGHAGCRELASFQLPDGRRDVLNCGDAAALHCTVGQPIALLLACYTAAFDAPQRCLADELLRSAGGPVAVIGGSRVTMPYGMTVLGSELLDELFVYHTPTLGDALLRAKRRSVEADGPQWNPRRLALDALAKTLSPAGADLAAERREHLYLFNLLGDPLLRMRYPRGAVVETQRRTTAGDWLTVAGRSPVDGDCTIELLGVRGGDAAPVRSQYDPSDKALAAYQPAYERANNPPLVSQQVRTSAGKFSARFRVPATAAGQCLIRAFIAGRDDFAVGTADVEVQGATASASSVRSR